MLRTRLYSIVGIACIAGYMWLAFLSINPGNQAQTETVCLIKNISGVPCPSCGASRSVLSILEGNFIEAAKSNPVGYILITILLVSPFWILGDLITHKDSFLSFYNKAEQTIRKKWIAIPMIVLILSNWIWNIVKEL